MQDIDSGESDEGSWRPADDSDPSLVRTVILACIAVLVLLFIAVRGAAFIFGGGFDAHEVARVHDDATGLTAEARWPQCSETETASVSVWGSDRSQRQVIFEESLFGCNSFDFRLTGPGLFELIIGCEVVEFTIDPESLAVDERRFRAAGCSEVRISS